MSLENRLLFEKFDINGYQENEETENYGPRKKKP